MKRWKKIIFVAAGVLCSGGIVGGTIVSAVFNEEEAVHIREGEIENSTLIIGTHLIHISALSDSLYDIASETAEISGQYNMYYKSELGEGRWYEISDASGLSDIMEEGTAVDGSVIEELFLRYHTKSDGITYDLKTGDSVCIFDIINPYSIYTLPELEAISMHYDVLREKTGKTETDERNMELIEAVAEEDLKTMLNQEDTDQDIESLQSYYEYSSSSGSETSQTVLSLMEELDSQRRKEVYTYLYYESLPKLLEDVQRQDGAEGFYVDYELVGAVGTAMDEVEKKLTEYEAKSWENDSTAAGREKLRLKEEAIAMAKEGSISQLDSLMENIEDLINIEQGITKNPKREAQMIKDILVPEALNVAANTGADDEERQSALWETEFLAKTALSSMGSETASDFLQSIADKITQIENDANVSDELLSSVESLKSQVLEMKGNLQGETSLMSELFAKKEELKLERMASLDKNNLTRAKELEEELNDLEEEIEKEENRLSDILTSDTSSNEEKEAAKSALEAGTSSMLIIETKENVQSALEEGEYDEAMDGAASLETFMATNSNLVLSSLQDIYNDVLAEIYLKGNDNIVLKEIKDNLESVISENTDTIEGEISAESLLGLIEELVGTVFGDMNDRDKAATAVSLYSFGDETNNSEVKSMGEGLISKLYGEDNPYVYEKLKSETKEFIGLKAFSRCSNYRYIFYNGSKSVTLRKGTSYYTYTVFKTNVSTREGKEDMETYARFQSDIYLAEEYMEEKFNVICMYIDNTSYSIIIDEKINERAAEFTESLYYYGTGN